MRTAIIISGILHATVVFLLVTRITLFKAEPPEPDVIPVEVVPEAELAEVSTPPPTPEPEPEETPPGPEPQPAQAPEPQPQTMARQAAEAVPPLEEVPEPQAKPEEPPEKPQPRPTRNISPRAKPEPPSRFSTSRIAALIDKAEEAEESAPAPRFDTEKLEKKLGQSSLDQRRQLATIQDMMRTQIERCWSVPAGAENAEDLVIRIRIELKPDGSLLSPPEIVNADRMSGPNGDFFRVAAESARRAVQRCSPLKLPVESYQIWRTTELTFDPSRMLSVN